MLLLKPAVAGANYTLKWSRLVYGISATSTSVDSSAAGGTDLIVIMGSGAAWDGLPATDNKSNSYTPAAIISAGTGDGGTSIIAYKANPSVGTGHTFTTPSANYWTCFVFGFAGVVASPLITTKTAGGSSSVTTVQPGSITPGFNNTLFVAGVINNVTMTGGYPLIDSGFIQPIPGQNNIASNYAGGAAYLLQGAGALVNPIWTSNTAYTMAACMACFKSVGS